MRILNEMARRRVDAMDKCQSLGEKFVEHFDKIYNEPESIAVSHWINEMNTWYNTVKNIQLKGNNKCISFSNIHDWFLTVCSGSEDLFDDELEAEAYDDFIDNFAMTRDIRKALEDSGII